MYLRYYAAYLHRSSYGRCRQQFYHQVGNTTNLICVYPIPVGAPVRIEAADAKRNAAAPLSSTKQAAAMTARA